MFQKSVFSEHKNIKLLLKYSRKQETQHINYMNEVETKRLFTQPRTNSTIPSKENLLYQLAFK